MAYQIKDNTGAVVTEAVTIRKYFGLPGQSTAEFMKDLKTLNTAAEQLGAEKFPNDKVAATEFAIKKAAADKTELAHGAAKELGWTVTEVPDAPAA